MGAPVIALGRCVVLRSEPQVLKTTASAAGDGLHAQPTTGSPSHSDSTPHGETPGAPASCGVRFPAQVNKVMILVYAFTALIGCGVQPSTLQLAEGAPSTVYSLDALSLPVVTALDAAGAPREPQPVATWSLDSAEIGVLDAAAGTVSPTAEGQLILMATAGAVATTWSVDVIIPDEVGLSGAVAGETLTVGATRQLSAGVMNGGALLSELPVTWTSSDAAIATVEKGLVSGLAPGEVTITAAGGGQQATLSLVVAPDMAMADVVPAAE